ncbi:proline racemase family protein, partial [Bacillus tropicus]|uniref:proline racemase family protein n=1 Tax=Bacillus tropicus TaxID=2026188 RepID=UPI00284CD7CF
MCGHGIIAVITVGIETGMFEVTGEKQKFIIDSTAGEVVAYAKYKGSEGESVAVETVTSFGYKKDVTIKI